MVERRIKGSSKTHKLPTAFGLCTSHLSSWSPPPGQGGGSSGNKRGLDQNYVTAVLGKYPGFSL